MTRRNDTLFERFLAPILQNLLIDRAAIMRYYRSKDWDAESNRVRNPQVSYPAYYQSQNFHGIEGGYLNLQAALTYDPVTQYALPPHEEWVRQSLGDRIRVKPRRILDLGCGTGSTTILLKRQFPQAEVIGLDLSPYMLVAAHDKAAQAGLGVQFRHGNAEQTGLPDHSFDLITAVLLFHETPVEVTQRILRESLRLLKVGGELLVLDGNQFTLRHTDWMMNIFEEPYIRDYAAGSMDAWMKAAGFGDVQTDGVWGIHQVSRGVKPMAGRSPARVHFTEREQNRESGWVMGFAR